MTDPFNDNMDDEDNYEIDLTGQDSGKDFTIPDGEYAAHVVGLTKGYSQAGNPMWTWDFAITEGDHAGKEYKVFAALTPAALWKLTEVLEAIGLAEAGKVAKFKKSDAIGKSAIVLLEAEEYKGVNRSSVRKVLPHPKGPGYAKEIGSPEF